ncbi:MAG: SDR family oxidoreductase [Candidatus Eisenbacteria bacterium]|uniref:SDR family oxidoreductase n=1 Tax=Eiseniibacteriota bacterium TaxID=2212470 RepID=A0A948RV14_UNCEI|nr:SDR family oxidoreductase [Candidatus Eisenbacteria bacterium]MBU1949172.1 SDR family oxidoreductase [Candidatus Eisenbacteria bacterium]MBU2690496.1 SDR family oxidoreductase [Candidatus Eisenbacteria bacterium]
MELKGCVTLVTGGGRRIGKAIVEHLAGRGALVAIHYHTSSVEAKSLAAGLQKKGLKGLPFRADLSRPAAIEELVRRIEKRLGPVSVLINSASIYQMTSPHQFSVSEWDRVMAVNLRAPALLSRAVGPKMKKAGQGVIINLGDWSIQRPYAGYAAYAASKAGLEALTKVLARELAPEVRVNMISPGAILPPAGALTLKKNAKMTAKIKMMAEAAVLKRMGRPADIAETVLFLIERSDFTTGINLLVDGGRNLQ